MVLILFAINTRAQVPSNDNHWEIIEDWNFKTMSATAFANDWHSNPCIKARDHGNGYLEPQFYKPNNVSLSSLGLKIEVKQENVFDKAICYLPDNHVFSDGNENLRQFYYTSGLVETKDSIKFGYMEARIKLPYGYDFFPAFWTFRTPHQPLGSNAAEIDIFEMLPSSYISPTYPNNNNIQKTNYHLCYAGCPGYNVNHVITDYTHYHKYAVEWSPNRIIWYTDDVPIRVVYGHGINNNYVKNLINLALTPFVALDGTQTTYPSNMMVDYVRWYKLNTDCEIVINDCVFNFAAYNPTVKKSVTIGGTNCTNVQPSNTNIVIRATDYIYLDGHFEVPLGSELYLDVDDCY